MWQSPNQKIRRLAEAKKREREKLKNSFHIRRVKTELKFVSGTYNPTTVMDVNLLLNDLTPEGVSLFSPHSILVGQEIAITLEEPKRTYIRGKIVSCHEIETEGHIMSEKAYLYRISVKFIFNSTDEEQAVRSFYEELAYNYLNLPKAA
ncbi:MAG: hypothetical protein AABZ06_07525 [Bdellovibrionota bacterium]